MAVTFTNMLSMLSQDLSQRIQDMDVLSNNLANINTTAYKSSRSVFQEMMGDAIKSGSSIHATQSLTMQGSAVHTGRLLDLYIAGDGYIPVQLPDGDTAYTRDGRLFMDSERRLVNSSGNPIIWAGQIPDGIVESQLLVTESGEVGIEIKNTVTSTRKEIDENGNQVEKPITYMAEDENGNEVERELTKQVSTFQKFGDISLARFTNPSALNTYGGNLYTVSENSGEAVTGKPGSTNFGKLEAQTYEASNVNMGEELTHLISLQRGMQLSSRSYQGIDRMIDQAIQMPRT